MQGKEVSQKAQEEEGMEEVMSVYEERTGPKSFFFLTYRWSWGSSLLSLENESQVSVKFWQIQNQADYSTKLLLTAALYLWTPASASPILEFGGRFQGDWKL